MKTPNIAILTQVRLGSSRLPNKVLKKLGDFSALSLHLSRLRRCKLISHFIVASTHEDGIDQVRAIAESCGFAFFQGDTLDVLDRFYQCTKDQSFDHVIRVTSDCPLIDPVYVDDLVQKYLASGADYASNSVEPTLPDGMDAEIFRSSVLQSTWAQATKKSDREHVTPYMIRQSTQFKQLSVKYPHEWGKMRLTLDNAEDLVVIQELVEKVGPYAPLEEYVRYLQENPGVAGQNAQFFRHQGYLKSLKEDQ